MKANISSSSLTRTCWSQRSFRRRSRSRAPTAAAGCRETCGQTAPRSSEERVESEDSRGRSPPAPPRPPGGGAVGPSGPPVRRVEVRRADRVDRADRADWAASTGGMWRARWLSGGRRRESPGNAFRWPSPAGCATPRRSGSRSPCPGTRVRLRSFRRAVPEHRCGGQPHRLQQPVTLSLRSEPRQPLPSALAARPPPSCGRSRADARRWRWLAACRRAAPRAAPGRTDEPHGRRGGGPAASACSQSAIPSSSDSGTSPLRVSRA